MNRSPRRKTQPKKFSPTQSSICSPQNYLLRFEDNGELIVAKRSSIRSIIEDKAIVGVGTKRRTAIVEAKGKIGTSSFQIGSKSRIFEFDPVASDLPN
ncbi:unnamed protein product [Rotaria sp. Silwood1]|nr:unnamed protein product [Rotaria sp. Silwood1]CAF1686471.1 unnamed protein product [Rotaria sp. Silwood1]